MMITRLMLSLKKAAGSQSEPWTLGQLTVPLGFIDRQDGTAARDEIDLETFSSTCEGVKSPA